MRSLSRYWLEVVLLLVLLVVIVTTTPGCGGKGVATHSVSGIVTNANTDYRNNVELTFKDGVEIKLKNGKHHPIFKNTPIQIDYDSKRCIVGVTRLNPPEEGDTVVIAVEAEKQESPSVDPLNRPVVIQVSQRPKDTWGVGSTMGEVKAIEGEPDQVMAYKHMTDIRWYYGDPGESRRETYVEFGGNPMRVLQYAQPGKYQFKKVSAIPVRVIKEKDR